ncbi:hypothetical protein ACSFXN_07095 [Planococcus sp. 1R117A]|uniref:hypothetical protein n=1 Tax=Planococcus sp. 1R117A TaxID=3447020 RepID=UPI003EDB99CD
MSKLITFSYVFFFIALTTQIIDFKMGGSDYYYHHFLQLALLVIVGCPIIGIVLGLYGKRGNLRLITLALNAVFFITCAPLAVLNLWIMTFGK